MATATQSETASTSFPDSFFDDMLRAAQESRVRANAAQATGTGVQRSSRGTRAASRRNIPTPTPDRPARKRKRTQTPASSRSASSSTTVGNQVYIAKLLNDVAADDTMPAPKNAVAGRLRNGKLVRGATQAVKDRSQGPIFQQRVKEAELQIAQGKRGLTPMDMLFLAIECTEGPDWADRQ